MYKSQFGEIVNDIETIKKLYRTYWKDMIAKNADMKKSR